MKWERENARMTASPFNPSAFICVYLRLNYCFLCVFAPLRLGLQMLADHPLDRPQLRIYRYRLRALRDGDVWIFQTVPG
jgi:hypothetical protein